MMANSKIMTEAEFAQQTMRNERRFTVLLVSILVGVGGWWLQNNHSSIEKLSTAIQELVLHVDNSYIDNKQMILMQRESDRRFNEVNADIKRILNSIEARHPPGRTPLRTKEQQRRDGLNP